MRRAKEKGAVKAAAGRAKSRAPKPRVTKPSPKKTAAPEERPVPGRPTVYDPALADEILERLAQGETLLSICKDDKFPHERTVRSWALDQDHEFSARYTHARTIGYHSMADEILEISDNGLNDWMERHGKDDAGWVANGDHIQRSRLRVDSRKWLLSKALPKIYGDRVIAEHTGKDGGPIETRDLTDTEAARRIAYMLGQAITRKRNAPVTG